MENEQIIEVKYLIMKKTPYGKAVFANRNFKEGEFIIEFLGKVYSMAEYKKKLNPKNNHYLQISSSKYLGPTRTPDNYINHSCNPNTGIKIFGRSVLLFAIRNIRKGEEITFDYSTSMAEDYWEMNCLCGCKNCRKKIRDFKHLPASIRKKYTSLGIVPDFVLKHATARRR
jgi:SET domain-containing protein